MSQPMPLWLFFARLSLFAVGGANAVIPEMQRHFVDAPGGLDGVPFPSLVALAQAAPGPNAMIVGLVGWHVAGVRGALGATLGFCGPPAILTLLVGRAWGRIRATRLGAVMIAGLAPLVVGLILASAWALVRSQGVHVLPVTITFLAAACVMWRPALAFPVLALGAGASMLLG